MVIFLQFNQQQLIRKMGGEENSTADQLKKWIILPLVSTLLYFILFFFILILTCTFSDTCKASWLIGTFTVCYHLPIKLLQLLSDLLALLFEFKAITLLCLPILTWAYLNVKVYVKNKRCPCLTVVKRVHIYGVICHLTSLRKHRLVQYYFTQLQLIEFHKKLVKHKYKFT